MKIIFITNFYPPASQGGYEQLCQEIAEALRNRGHNVLVLTSNYKSTELSVPDPKWVHRELYLEMELASTTNALQFFTRRKTRETQNLASLRQIMKWFSPDVVLIWAMWNLHLSLPALVEELMPGQTVYYICDYWPTLPNQFENYWNAPPRSMITGLPKLILKTFALQILARENRPDLKLEHAYCVSEYVRNTLVEAGRLQPHAEVLHNGIDPEPFLKASESRQNFANGQNRPLRLLYYGRLNHDKGVHTAIQALGLLKQRGFVNNFELTILGSGHPDYESELRQMSVGLGVSEQVEFVGHVHRVGIPNRLACFDVYLFTSIWPEPMARSVMEAMAAGLLVIGTEVGGQVEMLNHGKNALTFKPGDVKGLSDQILRAYHDPQLRVQLAQAGQLMVSEQFSLDRMVNEIENILQNIVKSPAPR